MQSREKIVDELHGQKIYLKEWIPETVKGTVVLIHGLGEHIGRYDHVAAAFNQAGYAVMGLDLPGHGRSGGIRGHISSYESVMDLISSRLQDAGQCFPEATHFLYGHSLGGNLVLYYALTRNPHLTGIISTSPGLGVATPPPALQIAMGKVLSVIAPSVLMDNGLDLSGLSHDPAVIEAYKNDPLVHGKISARLAIKFLAAGKWIIENASKFPAIPLLLLQGGADRIVSPQATDEFAQKCTAKLTYKVYPGLYHELHNEFEKEEIITTMIDWMNQQL
jgi:alpha-beta hydrolase superfamily lysophospholipase